MVENIILLYCLSKLRKLLAFDVSAQESKIYGSGGERTQWLSGATLIAFRVIPWWNLFTFLYSGMQLSLFP